MSRHLLACAILFAVVASANAEKNWPGWRGPHQNGHSEETGLPTSWSAESVTWKTPLEGWGQSSPTIWEHRIFLTTALEKGRERVVMCIDRRNGKVLWEQVAWKGEPEPVHQMNGWASSTCTTDGERVYAFFGRGGGLFCYTVDGELVWNAGNDVLGNFEGPWGTAACPRLVGDLVIQNCDADANSFIAAFDKRTGKEVWRTERPQIRGWSSPILYEVDGREQLIINGDKGVTAYEPGTGKQIWFCKSFIGRGSPTVTPIDGGLLCAVNGKPGPVYAIRPDGKGEVTATHREWHTDRKGGRDLPSPIAIGPYVLIVNMKGILSCYQAADGKELWRERIPGEYAAAPSAWNGKAFFVNLKGETTVVEPGPAAKIVDSYGVGAGNREICRAALTPSDGQVFLRTDRFLYCIEK